MRAELRFLPADLADLIETEQAGAAGLIRQLITDFRARLEGYLQEIEDAQSALNFPDLKRHTHTLKSTTRVLGLRAASEICKEMESLARYGVYSPRNLEKLRAEIFPALEELALFEQSREKS